MEFPDDQKISLYQAEVVYVRSQMSKECPKLTVMHNVNCQTVGL